MADTGAPWNIPYIEPTDLVRNYPAANELMADAIAAGLTAAGNPGIGSNVVSTTKVDGFTTTSTTFVDVTGLTATITPTSATSKILAVMTVVYGHAAGEALCLFNLVRGATDIAQGTGATANATLGLVSGLAAGFAASASAVFLDSPGVGTAVTYKVQCRTSAGTLAVNRRAVDTAASSVSTLALIEVAA